MPPKRNKGITPSVTPTGTANKSWETALTDAVFEEVHMTLNNKLC